MLLRMQVGSLEGPPREVSKDEIWKEFSKEISERLRLSTTNAVALGCFHELVFPGYQYAVILFGYYLVDG